MTVAERDMVDAAPDILQFWDYNRNRRAPRSYTPDDRQVVWWQCPNGHRWKSKISTMCRRCSCPSCAVGFPPQPIEPYVPRNVPKPGMSLAEKRPDLAAMWHPTKNGDLKPTYVFPTSQIRVWWQCPQGHEWEARVKNIQHGSRCPVCSRAEAARKKSIPKPGRSLAEMRPDLIPLWHPTKNGNLTPKDVSVGSNRKVWWQCPQGHEWQSIISNINHGNKCPECSRIRRRGGA